MRQRVFGLCLLFGSIWLGYVAIGFKAQFSYEPIGPRTFPWLVLSCIALAGAYISFFSKRLEEKEKQFFSNRLIAWKVILCIGNFVLYAFLFEIIGFILASLIFSYLMAWLYGAKWLQLIIVMSLLVFFLYALFEYVFDVPLPLGLLDF